MQVRATEFINEIGSMPAGFGAAITARHNTPLDGNTFGIEGYKVEFKPDGLYIFKGGELVWKKDGDYSNPMRKHLAGARKLITGLERKRIADPNLNNRPLFGPDPHKEDRRLHRKKREKAYNYSHSHGISFQDAWKKLYPEDDE